MKLDEKQAIAVGELNPTAHLALHHNQLSSLEPHSLLQASS
jgi:hypothetical protein